MQKTCKTAQKLSHSHVLSTTTFSLLTIITSHYLYITFGVLFALYILTQHFRHLTYYYFPDRYCFVSTYENVKTKLFFMECSQNRLHNKMALMNYDPNVRKYINRANE